jgi:hypothetical protein
MQTIERTKWVKALRSGDFPQTRHALRNESGYCCLGVACDIFSEELGLDTVRRYINDTKFDTAYDHQSTVLPQNVADFIGLRTREGRFSKYRHGVEAEGHEYEALTTLNDDGVTFEEIADILEDNEDLLFTDVAS